ncbi:hypothetical protein NO263_09590 [Gluconacetobacter entanii]|uniref:Uncharacterized protein n=1 Tax=Gluconacetobacter entanii TaxID=108528 RepID=A0A318PXN4_9PROT|nr:hypothetical protein [Gluconacetobacter entanii]MCE2578603.1 hypothetical protein [Komagataeibacter sp. FNDCR1]MCW4590832.1 hypothetical protein [Gluconacetobacter entanii]MCW4593999.1 hypothetical protein [Gluconacetobacter entanii]NPC90138.1 hypothetical protein [Gluconacetobacter entanii]PYD63845.1 hypothetical protein CFR72_05065 [Gluconacetobacter entanii]
MRFAPVSHHFLDQPPCPAPVPPMPPGTPVPPTHPPEPGEDPQPIDDPQPIPPPMLACWTARYFRNSAATMLLRESAPWKGNTPMSNTAYDPEKPVPKPDSEKDHDRDEALEESFPASDPPSKGETTGPDE